MHSGPLIVPRSHCQRVAKKIRKVVGGKTHWQAICRVVEVVKTSSDGTHQVTNGLAFCKIHHAAYDSDIVGVRPDGVAQVRRDVLEETDGPMLR